MLTQTLTYDTPEGEKVTQEWCFHISKAELAEQMLMRGENFQAHLQKIIAERKGEVIIPEFKKILVMAVGKKKDVGGRSILDKSEDVRLEFLFGGAYDKVFMNLLTEPDSGAQFINSLLPSDIGSAEEIKAAQAKVIQDIALPDPAANQVAATELPSSGTIEQAGTSDEDEDDLRAQLLLDDAGTKPVPEPTELEDSRPAWLKELRLPTKSELMSMSKPELQLATRLKAEGKIK